MNYNKPNKKCIAYLKMKGYIFDEIDNFGYYVFINNNNKDLLCYEPPSNRWFVYDKHIEIKLNELQQA